MVRKLVDRSIQHSGVRESDRKKMRSHLTRNLWIVFATLSIAVRAAAQTTGSVSGSVRDEQDQALNGVEVSAESPSLPGRRSVSTDGEGRFRMPSLPPGIYEIQAELAGFKRIVQSGVIVQLDRDVTLKFRFLPVFKEELTVLGAPALLDLTSAATGTIVERHTFEELPIRRSYHELAFLAPGVTNSAGARSDPTIAGASGAENRYIVEGLDTTDPGFGWLVSTMPPEFLDTVEIKTGGLAPEYGGALGGVINVLTRSGSNDLHGSGFGYYEDDGFGSDPPRGVRNDRFLGSTKLDYGATLGGRVLRDRLWYFAGVNSVSGESDLVTSQRLHVTDESDAIAYTGKLTGQVHPSHRLTASAFGNPAENTWNNTFAAGLLQTKADTDSEHFVLSYDGILRDDLSLEISAGRYDHRVTWSPGADRPWYIDGTGGRFARAENCGDPNLVVNGMSFAPGCLGGTFVYDPLAGLRDEVRLAGTWYGTTGPLSHEIKAGAMLREVKFEFNVRYPAPVAGPFHDSEGTLVDAGGLAGQLWRLGPGFAQLDEREPDGPGENEERTLFLQDEIAIGARWTLSVGLRADAFDSTGRMADDGGTSSLEFGFEDMIGPRLGIVWDPIGKGRSKLFAHYARYYESVPLWINTRIFGNTGRNRYNFRYPDDGSLPTVNNPGVLISSSRSTGGSRSALASDLEAQHNDEYLLGFEYQIGRDVSLGLTGVYREVGDVLEDFSLDDLATYIVGNPGGTLSRHPVTGAPLAEPVSFDEPTREYRALQLTFQKRLAGRWQLAGSYVYSKNEGNYSGLFQQDIGFSAPNLTPDFDLPELSQNASGPLPNDRTHQAKLFGSYQWSFGLVSGFFAQYLSGTPLSKRGYHAFFGPLRFVAPRGSAGRTPDLFTIDLRTEYPFLHKSGLTLSVFADVFNLTDNQKPIFVDEIWTYLGARRTEDPNECGGPGTGPETSCPSGNPNWSKPILFHTPRTLRLGTRLSW
ncbi:MAG: carboxypeptidase regulatory-like domain-containing protein [Thermoanaerobaculia bacterium]